MNIPKSYSRWFRFYAEALNDPKVQLLSPYQFKAWVNLLCLASETEGKLPGNDVIAFRLRMSAQDAERAVSDLILAGLIDILPDHSLAPHNWSKRQFKWDGKDRTAAARMKRMRNRKKQASDGQSNGSVTVDVTVNPSESVSVSDSENHTTEVSYQGKDYPLGGGVTGDGDSDGDDDVTRRAR